MPVTIIAEAGVNHNGDLEMAKKLALTRRPASTPPSSRRWSMPCAMWKLPSATATST